MVRNFTNQTLTLRQGWRIRISLCFVHSYIYLFLCVYFDFIILVRVFSKFSFSKQINVFGLHHGNPFRVIVGPVRLVPTEPGSTVPTAIAIKVLG
jgi:hypothetical protein